MCWACERHEPLLGTIPASEEFGTDILQQYTAVLPGMFTSAIVDPNVVDSTHIVDTQVRLIGASTSLHHVAPLSCAFVVEQTNLWQVEDVHNTSQRPVFDTRSWQWPVDPSVAVLQQQQQQGKVPHTPDTLDFATAVSQQKVSD